MHHFPVALRWSDFDPYGHLNHATYLALCEAARVALLDDIGFSMATLEAGGHRIVVVGVDARWLAPVVEGMAPVVVTGVGEVGRARSTWHQRIEVDGEVCFTALVTGAFVGLDGRPRRAPDGFAAAAGRVVG